jgi:hypothetical protein
VGRSAPPTDRMAHLSTAGDCRAAGFQSRLGPLDCMSFSTNGVNLGNSPETHYVADRPIDARR